jgi:hypothetical protein
MGTDRYPLKLYLKHRPIWIMVSVSLLANLGSWVWLGWHIRPELGSVFLHYTVLFGVDLTGPWYRVFAAPIIGMSIIAFNHFLGWLFFHKDRFVSYVLGSVAVLCNVILLIVAALLVFLNV